MSIAHWPKTLLSGLDACSNRQRRTPFESEVGHLPLGSRTGGRMHREGLDVDSRSQVASSHSSKGSVACDALQREFGTTEDCAQVLPSETYLEPG